MIMYCDRCGNKLFGMQKRWCSSKCSKLGLKSLYKKRKKDQVNTYNRKYRKSGVRISGIKYEKSTRVKHLKIQPCCQRCGSTEDLQVAHIRPRWAGGKHKSNMITFCRSCHCRFDNLLRDFWKSG